MQTFLSIRRFWSSGVVLGCRPDSMSSADTVIVVQLLSELQNGGASIASCRASLPAVVAFVDSGRRTGLCHCTWADHTVLDRFGRIPESLLAGALHKLYTHTDLATPTYAYQGLVMPSPYVQQSAPPSGKSEWDKR